jgi:superfamily II DNA or RNA helicase
MANAGLAARPVDTYTATDVEDWLSPREVAKGRSYLDKVSRLEVGDVKVGAVVQGSVAQPYRVTITLAVNGHNFPREMRCTCPVGIGCKHVAATLLKVIAMRGQVERVSPATIEWLEALKQLSGATTVKSKPVKQQHRLYWKLSADDPAHPRLACFKGRSDAADQPTGPLEPWSNFEQALARPMKFVGDDDVFVIRLLLAQSARDDYYRHDRALLGRHGSAIIARLLESGRFYGEFSTPLQLRSGQARHACIGWRQDVSGRFHAIAEALPPLAWVLPLDPPLYVDGSSGEVGHLSFDVPPAVATRILAAPPLNEAEARMAALVLAETAPGVAAPTTRPAREIDVAPRPVLNLVTFVVPAIHRLRNYPRQAWGVPLDAAQLSFQYDEVLLAADSNTEFANLIDGETVRIRRHQPAEAACLQALKDAGFERITRGAVQLPYGSPIDHRGLLVLDSEAAWTDFMAETRPRLIEAGWDVFMPPDFRHHVLQVDSWDAEIDESESGWFDVDMGIVVDGNRLSLAPLLATLFQRDPRWLDAVKLARIEGAEKIELLTPDGNRVRVLAERLKPLARTLIDMFDGLPNGKLRLSRFDAPRLEMLTEAHWNTQGLEAVQKAAHKLAGLGGVKPVDAPAGFALELRPYQREGLAWLQYLREHGLAGILADDMGLGKTAQTLAHLLMEKEAGRLDHPALVVLPTSLIFNWQSEATRFAPELSLLSLQGKARKERFADIPHYDVVLTTYPLLWRDADELAKHEYHLLILDEAQTVKNAASKGATVVRNINARHRLCLTGTPLENHLGELWAQFDFLLPGFLGDSKSFAKTWRTPIEKRGDSLRRDLLASRIRPFILRRRKDDVAKELPPKSIIVRTVELQSGQRDLYETVRSAMDMRVREEVANRGFARSQIVILDALLKLRQVCCDPRLVKLPAARRVKERAKLDLLMTMVPELVEEGRRILLFSQFTAMLALIEEELNAAGLPYVILTGDTRDRETPIRRFQGEEVPIFLISLKAGGLGLNLTAADTVIHYDPWWNPAVENQATDRAHRIGQTKPVFVYKLVVAGSIEEKILVLQEKKAELAAGILSEDRAGVVKFSESDLRALLEPLPANR